MVGVVGFEPTTFPPQMERTPRLCYTPLIGIGAGIRTPINGFGDRYVAITPHP